jgi:hypothetical protein
MQESSIIVDDFDNKALAEIFEIFALQKERGLKL